MDLIKQIENLIDQSYRKGSNKNLAVAIADLIKETHVPLSVYEELIEDRNEWKERCFEN